MEHRKSYAFAADAIISMRCVQEARRWGGAMRLGLWLVVLGSLGFSASISAQDREILDANRRLVKELDQEADEQTQRIRDAISQLSSSKFALREEAFVTILKIGRPAVPFVIEASKSDDLEVRMRSRQLLERLTRNDFESQVAAFLAGTGDDDAMPGWTGARTIIGESPGARELFIEASRSHRELIAAFNGGPAEISPLLAKVAASIRERVMVKFKQPERGDLTALLLACGEPLAEISADVEQVVGRLASGPIVNETLGDKRLASVFRRLLGGWIHRAKYGSQTRCLMIGLQYDVSDALDLALRNLALHSKAEDSVDSDFLEGDALDILELSFLAIARFGTIDHTYALSPLLNDSRRMMVSPMYFEGKPLRVEVRDMATAALIRLLGGNLQSAGFPAAREHPKVVFVSGSLGFSEEDKERRARVDAYVQQLLKKEQ